jgi:hypothetical protein
MKRAAASTAARNNGPGGDSAAGASPLTTVDRILDSPATDAEICSAEPPAPVVGSHSRNPVLTNRSIEQGPPARCAHPKLFAPAGLTAGHRVLLVVARPLRLVGDVDEAGARMATSATTSPASAHDSA